MPQAGESWAGYAIRRRLGQGTTGAVYLAQDLARGTWVALKVLRDASGASVEVHEDLRSRFLLESEVALRLRHPDIVEVYHAGAAAGTLWVAMELVPGCSLARYTEPKRLLPHALVVDVITRVAGALAHAHTLGVVHRDIKPSNILVDLPAGIVKLGDFGTAKLADSGHTRTGMMLGTPAYMAPEQLAGADADARGDLYSLGVVMFELLTGHRPHEAASMGDFLRAVAAQPAPDLRQHWPQAPKELAETVTSLLARARLHMDGPSAQR